MMNYTLFVILATLAVCAECEFYSSVWCHGSHQSHRHCSFRNLCYSPVIKQFLFFHHPAKTVIAGIDSPAEQIRLARLSSLEGLEDNLDDLFLDYTMLPSHVSKNYNLSFENKHTLVIKRWRPDHIQNVFHDDLLPIHFTLKYLCYGDIEECLEKYQIVVADAQGKHGLYEELYEKILSPAKIIYLRDQALQDPNHLTCYSKLSVGLETETMWYDYGFFLNGKEGSRENPNLRPGYLEEFREFVLKKLHFDEPSTDEPADVVVILPQFKTRLQNPEDVVNVVKNVTLKALGNSANVAVMSFDPKNIFTLIQKVSSAKILIGLTEGSLVTALFLPKDSAVVEMFPHGLSQENTAFIQTLASSRGLIYHSWINQIRKNSVGHPEYEPEKGGLMHLDQKVRKAIEKMDQVGDVRCCDDPAFLYKFFQETKVDPETFGQAVSNGFGDLVGKIDSFEKSVEEWILPAKIFNGKCEINPDGKSVNIEVTWDEPLNLKYISHKSLAYEVVIQADLYTNGSGTELLEESSTVDRSVTFSISTSKLRKYRNAKVWVAVVLDHDLRGSDTLVNCDLDSSILV